MYDVCQVHVLMFYFWVSVILVCAYFEAAYAATAYATTASSLLNANANANAYA